VWREVIVNFVFGTERLILMADFDQHGEAL